MFLWGGQWCILVITLSLVGFLPPIPHREWDMEWWWIDHCLKFNPSFRTRVGSQIRIYERRELFAYLTTFFRSGVQNR